MPLKKETKPTIPFLSTCAKVNVIARLEFELAYYASAVHRFNHYTTRTSRLILDMDTDSTTNYNLTEYNSMLPYSDSINASCAQHICNCCIVKHVIFAMLSFKRFLCF